MWRYNSLGKTVVWLIPRWRRLIIYLGSRSYAAIQLGDCSFCWHPGIIIYLIFRIQIVARTFLTGCYLSPERLYTNFHTYSPSFFGLPGTPINRLPIMAKSVLDLYELYNLVIARGGLVDVINKKLWQEIIKGLHLPSSITSAAFTLRTQ